MKLNPIQKALVSYAKETFKKEYDEKYPGSYKRLRFKNIELDKGSCWENSSSLENIIFFNVSFSFVGTEIVAHVYINGDGTIIGCEYV